MAQETTSSSLTAQLYSLEDSAVKAATKHPFLEQAGKGALPASTLCTWLVQDKFYQLAYVNFIGGLLAKLPLEPCAFPHSDEENLPRSTLDTLMGALTNIREEIIFYDKTVDKYQLPVEETPRNETTNSISNYLKT